MGRKITGLVVTAFLLAGPAMAQDESERRYWYDSGGTAAGPVDETEIERLLGEGVIDEQTLLWTPDLEGWEPASSFEALAEAFTASSSDQPSIMTGDAALTLAQLLSGSSPEEDIAIEIIGAQEAVFSSAGPTLAMQEILAENLPPAGDRRFAVTVEILDAGESSDRVAGVGFAYGLGDPGEPALVAVVSPTDGGVVQLAERDDTLFDVKREYGDEETRIGQPIRLTLREAEGFLEMTAGGATFAINNDITRATARGDREIALIFIGQGSYRLTDLEISGPSAGN